MRSSVCQKTSFRLLIGGRRNAAPTENNNILVNCRGAVSAPVLSHTLNLSFSTSSRGAHCAPFCCYFIAVNGSMNLPLCLTSICRCDGDALSISAVPPTTPIISPPFSSSPCCTERSAPRLQYFVVKPL